MFLTRTTLSCTLCTPLPNYDLLIVVPDVLVPRRVCPACLHRYRLTSSFCTLLQAKKDLTSIRHNVRVGCLRARELSLHLASLTLQRFRIPSVCTGNPIPTRRSETIFQVSNSESRPRGKKRFSCCPAVSGFSPFGRDKTPVVLTVRGPTSRPRVPTSLFTASAFA